MANRVLVCSFLSDGKKRKKNLFIFTANHYTMYCTSSNLVDKLQNSALCSDNCKTQPCCSDKLQNSALLLRQTAKLSPVAQTNCKTQPGCSDKLQTQPGCMGDVNAVSCHPALCRPRASTFQNKSFTEASTFQSKSSGLE